MNAENPSAKCILPAVKPEPAAAAEAERAFRPRLSIVIPCYNEELALPETCSRLCALLDELNGEALIAGPSVYYNRDPLRLCRGIFTVNFSE
jgi:hypothetical protein